MNTKKPLPLVSTAPSQNRCPVCGKTAYSRGGIHPQCATARSDAEFKALKKAEALTTPAPATTPWNKKKCPQCQQHVPARRFACECGHQFVKSHSNAVHQ